VAIIDDEKEKINKWEYCNCDFFEKPSIIECGCGKKHLRLYRDEVIHWQGKHWDMMCAFEEALNQLKRRES